MRTLEDYLVTFPYDFQVRLEQNTPESYLPCRGEQQQRGSRYGSYKSALVPGDNISAGGYIVRSDGERVMPPTATLGCWVEVKTAGDPETWTKYALTSYRGIRPAFSGYRMGICPGSGKDSGQRCHDREGSKLETNNSFPLPPLEGSDLCSVDRRGIPPTAGTKYPLAMHGIESRARGIHRSNMARWRMEFRKWYEKKGALFECLQRETDMGFLIPPQHLGGKVVESYHERAAFVAAGKEKSGTIFAASGFTRRTPTNGRLDWALIKPTGGSRIGTNTVSSAIDQWNAMFAGAHYALERSMTLKEPCPEGVFPGRFELYKHGAITGHSEGRVSYAKSDVVF